MSPADLIIAPIALFAWLLQAADPLPAGPGLTPTTEPAAASSPSSSPTSTSIYNDKGQRLGYTVPHPDGSVDIFRPDGSRLGYSTGGRTVITPKK